MPCTDTYLVIRNRNTSISNVGVIFTNLAKNNKLPTHLPNPNSIIDFTKLYTIKISYCQNMSHVISLSPNILHKLIVLCYQARLKLSFFVTCDYVICFISGHENIVLFVQLVTRTQGHGQT